MTEAAVQFLDIHGEPCPDGQRPARFTFRCVGWNRGRDPRLPQSTCNNLLIAEGPHSAAHGIKHDGQGQNGGRPQWRWDGNREAPTFSPSINCADRGCWHGYIRNGRCVSVAGTDEP